MWYQGNLAMVDMWNKENRDGLSMWSQEAYENMKDQVRNNP